MSLRLSLLSLSIIDGIKVKSASSACINSNHKQKSRFSDAHVEQLLGVHVYTRSELLVSIMKCMDFYRIVPFLIIFLLYGVFFLAYCAN